jgi:hypothetical protein
MLLEQNQAEQDKLNAQLADFRDAEEMAWLLGNEDQLVKIQEQEDLVLEQLRINKEEEERITEESADKQRDIEQKALEARLKQYSDFTGAMKGFIDVFASESREAAIASKVLGAAEIAINTAKGISAGVALGWPAAIPAVAYATVTGATALASLVKTSIPSAETGASFIANGPPGVDTNLVRVNNKERIDVTPAGQTGQQQGGPQEFNSYGYQSAKEMLWDIVNEGFRTGALIAVPGGNL